MFFYAVEKVITFLKMLFKPSKRGSIIERFLGEPKWFAAKTPFGTNIFKSQLEKGYQIKTFFNHC